MVNLVANSCQKYPIYTCQVCPYITADTSNFHNIERYIFKKEKTNIHHVNGNYVILCCSLMKGFHFFATKYMWQLAIIPWSFKGGKTTVINLQVTMSIIYVKLGFMKLENSIQSKHAAIPLFFGRGNFNENLGQILY